MLDSNSARRDDSLPTRATPGSPEYSPRAFVLLAERLDERAMSLAGRLERYRSTRLTTQLDELERLLQRQDELTGIVLLANQVGTVARQGAQLAALLCPELPRAAFSVREAHRAGIEDSLSQCEENILRFVRHALIAESCAHPTVARSVLDYAEAKGLTPREAEILATNVVGIERGQMVAELGISCHTFKRQVKSLLRKCDAEALDRVAVGVLLAALTARPAKLAV